MKIYAVIEGEFNESSMLRGVFSTEDKALIQVKRCKEQYFIEDVKWKEGLHNEWVHGCDYIRLVKYEIDEYYDD